MKNIIISFFNNNKSIRTPKSCLKKYFLTISYGSLSDCYDPSEVLEKVRASLDFLPTCNQIGVEAEILRHIMPAIREAVAAATATKVGNSRLIIISVKIFII